MIFQKMIFFISQVPMVLLQDYNNEVINSVGKEGNNVNLKANDRLEEAVVKTEDSKGMTITKHSQEHSKDQDYNKDSRLDDSNEIEVVDVDTLADLLGESIQRCKNVKSMKITVQRSSKDNSYSNKRKFDQFGILKKQEVHILTENVGHESTSKNKDMRSAESAEQNQRQSQDQCYNIKQRIDDCLGEVDILVQNWLHECIAKRKDSHNIKSTDQSRKPSDKVHTLDYC